MPKIEFRGKTYNNEFEMPPEVRQAYNREKEGHTEKNKIGIKSLTDIVDMSPEVQAIYERALGKVEESSPHPDHRMNCRKLRISTANLLQRI